jgi:hypothetical protein
VQVLLKFRITFSTPHPLCDIKRLSIGIRA